MRRVGESKARRRDAVPERRRRSRYVVIARFSRRARQLQKIRERAQLLLGHVSELLVVNRDHRRIERVQDVESFGGDARPDLSSIRRAALSLDESRLLEPIHEPSDVGHLGNHAVADVVATQAGRPRAAKNSQHVVLRRRDVERLQGLGKRMCQHRRGALEIQMHLLLEAFKRLLLFDLGPKV